MPKNFLYVIVGLLVIAASIGLGIGFYLNATSKKITSSPVVSPQVSLQPQQSKTIYPTPTIIKISGTPIPTSNPYTQYPSTIYAKTEEKFSFNFPGGAGDWPRTVKLTIYKVVNGKNTPATWDDIKVGQHARLQVVVPGKEGILYIAD